MSSNFYIKLFRHIKVSTGDVIKLGDIASCYCQDESINWRAITMLTISEETVFPVVLDIVEIVKGIERIVPEVSIQVLGHTEMVLEKKEKRRWYHVVLFLFSWLLLFTGAAVAITYFHEDVSMHFVHEKLYYVLTNEQSDTHYWLSVPYSFGLGIGMIIFYNHFSKRAFSKDPSPLEVEILEYQQAVDNFIVVKEEKRNNNES